jgi:N-acetylglutamate synthase-like GNAT family acetyltransferase
MIRKFKSSDAKKASQVILECVENSLSYEGKNKEFMVMMSQPEKLIEKSLKSDFFVNEYKGEIIGTGGFDKGEIKTMFILPKLQRRCFGKEMLNFLIEYAKSKGHEKVFLYSSPAAEGFYKKQGFLKIEDNYDFDFHTIYMERNLTN